jgi:N-acetylmuramoyl-L-alanine amidase
LTLALLSLTPFLHAQKSNTWASTQFQLAEKLRADLEDKPEAERTRREYQRVLNNFRVIYLEAPTSSKADPSAFATGEMLQEMGSRFHDEKILRDAIEQYQFLADEYPGSKARVQALFNTGEIYRDLGDADEAADAFRTLIKQYPRNALADDARTALADILKAQNKPKSRTRKSVVAEKQVPANLGEQDRGMDPPAPKKVVVAADADAKPARGSRPERAPVVSEIPPATKTHVTGLRFWSNPEYTRIAIDLDQDVRYESQNVENPRRIVFDLQSAVVSSPLTPSMFDVNDGILKRIRIAQYKPDVTRVVLEPEGFSKVDAFLLANPARLIVVVPKPKPAAGEIAIASAAPDTPVRRIVEADDAPIVTRTPRVKSAPTVDVDSEEPLKPDTATSASNSSASREAAPTSDGNRSLIRALGLKIGRIVIDPGHGGHDTGTIGADGLYEKDVVLDIGQRLGRLLQARLAADVIYTRKDDTFIPLEERTAIANRDLADLFISIHANSSTDPEARGVETYYLNFSSSPEALEVAARENATSEKSIHELQDLVKKIALKEKIEESREFAADVQSSLYSGVAARSAAIHDRGVKKAPFVVLIGANMPSILAEISFLSNPEDEERLRSPEYRQRIAQALYLGIAKYVNGLSGVKVASKLDKTHRQ